MPFSDLIFPLDKHLTLPKVPVNRLRCVWLDDLVASKKTSELEFGFLPFSKSGLHSSEIVNAGFLTESTVDKPVFFLDLCLPVAEAYSPGDTVGIFAENNHNEIRLLISRLTPSIDDDGKVCQLSGLDNSPLPKHLPKNPISVKHLLSRYVDLRAPIKKIGLASLVKYAKDEVEARRLMELSSREAPSLASPLTLPLLLDTLKSLHPDLETVLNLLPQAKPRPYSIANSPLNNVINSNGEISTGMRIVLSLVENGIASNYLCNFLPRFDDICSAIEDLSLSSASKNPVISVYMRNETDFRIPKDLKSTSVIMIATGTGIAPYIGMLEHREFIMKEILNTGNCDVSDNDGSLMSLNLAPWYLFYGCRDHKHRLFRKEIEEFIESGVLSKQLIAFSREDSSENHKYVQDYILAERDWLVPLLVDSDKTLLYICGEASKMVPSVIESLKQSFKLLKGHSDEEAASMISDLMKAKRIITDAWNL